VCPTFLAVAPPIPDQTWHLTSNIRTYDVPVDKGLRNFDAAIFDMDGLLLESESLWQQAEADAADRLGVPLGDADFPDTTGVRMGDVVTMWFDRYPWPGPTPSQVADEVVDHVTELIAGSAPLPGVVAALDLCAGHGLRLALCSSSADRLIEAVLTTLNLTTVFELTHSAENDEHGKPHPQPYISTAAKLGVDPQRCLAFEDSVAGCRSAKGAGMTVIAVPEVETIGLPGFTVADRVLTSLTSLDGTMLRDLDRQATSG